MNMLFSLAIFLIIISSMLTLLSFLKNTSEQPNDLRPFEWELFSEQVSYEIKQSSQFQVTSEGLMYTNPQNQRVTVSRYNDLIRRQIGGKGHEVLLQQVKSFNAVVEESGVTLSIVSAAGKQYELKTYLYQEFKGENHEK